LPCRKKKSGGPDLKSLPQRAFFVQITTMIFSLFSWPYFLDVLLFITLLFFLCQEFFKGLFKPLEHTRKTNKKACNFRLFGASY